MPKSPSKKPVADATEGIPPLLQISAGIRAVQAALLKHYERTQTVVLKFGEERKYAAVEIGWHLLRLKEVLDHGNVGNQNAAKNKTETVSALITEGFVEGVRREFDIEERTARNYMTAARNAGLTEKSTTKEVAKLRKTKALADTPLAKLYRTEENGEALTPLEEARRQMEFAQARLCVGKGALFVRLRAEVITEALPAYLTPDEIEDAYHTLREATDKVGQMRKIKRKAA